MNKDIIKGISSAVRSDCWCAALVVNLSGIRSLKAASGLIRASSNLVKRIPDKSLVLLVDDLSASLVKVAIAGMEVKVVVAYRGSGSKEVGIMKCLKKTRLKSDQSRPVRTHPP